MDKTIRTGIIIRTEVQTKSTITNGQLDVELRPLYPTALYSNNRPMVLNFYCFYIKLNLKVKHGKS